MWLYNLSDIVATITEAAIGAYRLFVLLASLIGLTLLCYEVSFHRALILFLMVTCRLLKDFKYGILTKDAAIVSISFLLAFGVSFASTYGYLNLRMSDISLLDLITSVLGVVFIVQFLYVQ